MPPESEFPFGIRTKSQSIPICQDKVSLTIHEPVNATFALRYLVNFSKARARLLLAQYSYWPYCI